MNNQCDKCGQKAKMLNRFNEKWLCDDCFMPLYKKREEEYYYKLRKSW